MYAYVSYSLILHFDLALKQCRQSLNSFMSGSFSFNLHLWCKWKAEPARLTNTDSGKAFILLPGNASICSLSGHAALLTETQRRVKQHKRAPTSRPAKNTAKNIASMVTICRCGRTKAHEVFENIQQLLNWILSTNSLPQQQALQIYQTHWNVSCMD